MRRDDQAIGAGRIAGRLATAFAARVATILASARPSVVSMRFVADDGSNHFHGATACGHPGAEVDRERRGCFEADEAAPVSPYGRLACDTTPAFALGTVRVVERGDPERRFFERFIAAYASDLPGRPHGLFPRLRRTTVYGPDVASICGTFTRLPAADERWPVALTRTPGADRSARASSIATEARP